MLVYSPTATSNYSSLYQNSGVGAGYAGAKTASSANANQPSSSASADQVTLSDAARALLAQDSASGSGSNSSGSSGNSSSSGSSDFSQESQLLTTLTDKSLAAMGIVSPSDEANTQITFNSLSYDVSDTSSAGVSQQGQQFGAAVGNSEEATMVGEGQIVTSNGTTYDFQIQLQVGQSDAAGVSSSGNTGTDNGGFSGLSGLGGLSSSSAASNASVGNSYAAYASSTTEASGSWTNSLQADGIGSQIVNALAQNSADSANSASGSGSGADGSSALGSINYSGGSSTSSSGIDWNSILKQTQSLFDLLDSVTSLSGLSSAATSGTATASAQTPATAVAAAAS